MRLFFVRWATPHAFLLTFTVFLIIFEKIERNYLIFISNGR